MECPRAYHATCIPPIARFHELAVLCHEHSSTHKLPELDLAASLQGHVEDKIDRKLLKLKSNKRRKLGSDYNPFFLGVRGDRLSLDEKYLLDYFKEQEQHHHQQQLSEHDMGGMLYFCLPCDIRDEVYAKPPTYKHLHSNRYHPDNRPKKIPATGDKCQCMKQCDEHCFNRIVAVECYGEGKHSNCCVGSDKCGNRSLGKRQYAKCKPMREQGKGWGLITVDGIKKGELVQEYMGEIIDEATKEKRLEDWSKEHPNDPNFYIMELQTGWYIDARHEANLSRFINHSCDPNCKIVSVNVRGHMRVGIYSLRDLAPGEFLSYDYHFDTKHGDKFICRCGAANCRGTMKGGQPLTDDKKILNWKEAKAKFDLDKKYLEDMLAKQQISQVDALIPAAEQPTEFVSSGPQDRYRDTAIRNRIFLWRNVIRGSDFTERFAALETPKMTMPTLSSAPTTQSKNGSSVEKEMNVL